MAVPDPADEGTALIDRIYLLLQLERTLLEAGEPDWGRLEENLAGIAGLFERLPPILEGPAGEAGSALREQLDEVIALRRENLEILQGKACELGCQITLLKQGKTALHAYTDEGDPLTLLRGLV